MKPVYSVAVLVGSLRKGSIRALLQRFLQTYAAWIAANAR
jgi:hypothetical protein